MKVYVAGRFKKKEEIEKYYSYLEKEGHEITYRWTRQGSIKPFLENKDKANEYIDKDFKGIKQADAFIFVAEYEVDSRGCYIELGYALNESERRPLKIIVIEKDENPSMFYMSPRIILVKSFDEAKDLL